MLLGFALFVRNIKKPGDTEEGCWSKTGSPQLSPFPTQPSTNSALGEAELGAVLAKGLSWARAELEKG